MLFLTSIELKVNKKSVTANISCGHFNEKFESNAPREQSFVNQFFRNERTCQSAVLIIQLHRISDATVIAADWVSNRRETTPTRSEIAKSAEVLMPNSCDALSFDIFNDIYGSFYAVKPAGIFT